MGIWYGVWVGQLCGVEIKWGERDDERAGHNGYKYLWILEGAKILQKKMKKKIGNEYLRRVKSVVNQSCILGT